MGIHWTFIFCYGKNPVCLEGNILIFFLVRPEGCAKVVQNFRHASYTLTSCVTYLDVMCHIPWSEQWFLVVLIWLNIYICFFIIRLDKPECFENLTCFELLDDFLSCERLIKNFKYFNYHCNSSRIQIKAELVFV